MIKKFVHVSFYSAKQYIILPPLYTNTKSFFMKTAYYFIIPFFIYSLNVLNAQKGISVETLQLSTSQESSVKIDYGNSANSVESYGLHIEGATLTSGQKGGLYGIIANTASDYSVHKGKTLGRLALSKTFSGDAFFIGAGGHAETTRLANSNGLFSRVIGGDFSVLPTTDVTPSGDKFWIAGVRAVLGGTINYTRTSNSLGAFAAVVAIDDSQGTAESWAGYFQGKSYLSDKTIIGTTTIPTAASTTEVEQFIENNGHLPNIPAGEVLDKNGIPLAKMTILQQEKIEELFLHSIQLNKENQALKAENKALKNRLDKIEQRLLALEK